MCGLGHQNHHVQQETHKRLLHNISHILHVRIVTNHCCAHSRGNWSTRIAVHRPLVATDDLYGCHAEGGVEGDDEGEF